MIAASSGVSVKRSPNSRGRCNGVTVAVSYVPDRSGRPDAVRGICAPLCAAAIDTAAVDHDKHAEHTEYRRKSLCHLVSPMLAVVRIADTWKPVVNAPRNSAVSRCIPLRHAEFCGFTLNSAAPR